MEKNQSNDKIISDYDKKNSIHQSQISHIDECYQGLSIMKWIEKKALFAVIMHNDWFEIETNAN